MIQRGVIVARIKPGAEEKVAALFAESDAGKLPALAGVRHRSLFVLGDVYVHLVEIEGDVGEAVADVRDHPLFKAVEREARALHRAVRPRHVAVARRTRWPGASTAGTPEGAAAPGGRRPGPRLCGRSDARGLESLLDDLHLNPCVAVQVVLGAGVVGRRARASWRSAAASASPSPRRPPRTTSRCA